MTERMFAIASLVEGCLGRISQECFAKGLIDGNTLQATTDGGASHTSHYIGSVLGSITKKIQQDPGNLKVFVDQVLATMGGFTDKLVKQLSESECS